MALARLHRSAVVRLVSARLLWRSVLAPAAAALLAGCGVGIHLPPPTTTNPAGVTGNELPTPPGPAERAAGSASPRAAARAFAAAYINWDAKNVSARLRSLARASVGQARSELMLEAAEVRADHELSAGGVANRGTVEAVTREPGGRPGGSGTADSGAATDSARYVVVTREQTTATSTAAYDGLRPAWHVALATVKRVDGGRRWAVSAWQPES